MFQMIINYNNWLNEKKYTHKELNNNFWIDYEFDDGIRKKLIKIAKNFYKTLPLDIEIDDIKLTGSMANYNYTSQSDLDVHIVINYNDYDNERKILDNMLRAKGFIWNLKHDINIRGADVELYVQDIGEEHIATGLFSLKNNKWIKKPKYTDPDVDEGDVRVKFNKWVYEIEQLVKYLNDDLTEEESEKYYERADKLRKKIKKFRQKGLHEGGGEFSVENIVFKNLRNKGYIGKLFDSFNKYYDMMFSQ